MKKYIFLLFLVCNTYVHSQDYGAYLIDFEDTNVLSRLTIDTISNKNNSWQIGTPNKDYLSNARSKPNVIITDTINPYPAIDTSGFYITHIADQGYEYNQIVRISGYYKVDCDSIYDYGKIEISLNNGKHWFDPLSDTIPENYIHSTKPVFTGKSDWTNFEIWLANDLTFNSKNGDTIIYKFLFISDSIQNNRDGLMFDDLIFEDWFESVQKNDVKSFNSYVYPNPGKANIRIVFDNPEFQTHSATVYTFEGKIVYDNCDIKAEVVHLDVDNLNNGIYFYKLINEITSERSTGKFVIE